MPAATTTSSIPSQPPITTPIYGILNSTSYAESGTDKVRFQRDFTYRDPKTIEREDFRIFQQQLGAHPGRPRSRPAPAWHL